MVDYSSIRSKLEIQLFSRFGKNVTLKSVATPTYNSRGEIESSTYSESSIIIVDYNITNSSKSREQWGNYLAGDRIFATDYTSTIAVDDIVVIGSDEYTVVEVRKPELEEVVAQLIQIRLITA